MDCSPPGSSVHEILQVRIQEWVAIPSSSGSSQPGDLLNPGIKPSTLMSPALAGGFFTLAPPGKPKRLRTKQSKMIGQRKPGRNAPYK